MARISDAGMWGPPAVIIINQKRTLSFGKIPFFFARIPPLDSSPQKKQQQNNKKQKTKNKKQQNNKKQQKTTKNTTKNKCGSQKKSNFLSALFRHPRPPLSLYNSGALLICRNM
jgi:hypothetical protein